MSEWQDIASAPKDQVVLLYGKLDAGPRRELYGDLSQSVRVAGYWDMIDQAWSPVGGTWEGPWIEATHWKPLDPPPSSKDTQP